jgi:hypothetical protein
MELVFEGSVAATEKNRPTGPNATECNRTSGCGCSVFSAGSVAGCLKLNILKNRSKTGCNLLQLVFLQ